MSKNNTSKAAPAMKQADISEHAFICDTTGVTMLKDSYLKVILQMPLPGIVIFVHGVNSDGEWYDSAEEGLCQGLNDRLKRNDDQMAHATAQGGQLTPAKYMGELTPDGFINADRQPDNFIEEDGHFSPVLRFRWGYKASSEELQAYGDGIYLNEQNYWGGGPFANGCTSLPDLWSEGISQSMFLWWNIGHFNPLDDRPVFSCPPRPYFVLAALRLAKLIESIRKLQANVPVTIVCHSQGNMVAIAAAFLGDRMPEVASPDGISGRCVADSYVLCNPPYSLQTAQFIENWSERHMKDREGGSGRQTAQARMQTMANFFDIIRKPSSASPQEPDDIDRMMANKRHQFDTGKDREAYGYGTPKHTCGRVTLYCNPHDQVISATTIRGIGWLGMSAEEIDKTNGRGIFCQRVFAQDFDVGGTCKQYEYWGNNHRKVKEGSNNFWMPPSATVSYSLSSDASKDYIGKIVTFASAPLMILLTKAAGVPVNAVPPAKWAIPLDAPNLPKAFKPMGLRNAPFDEGRSSPGEERDVNRAREKDDPYGGNTEIKQHKGEPVRPLTDAGKGDVKSEAQLRYEHHGRLRMEARRAGFAKKGDEHVTAEDEPGTASKEYKDWRGKRIKGYLANNVDSNATDHSTIMTNSEHAKMALAYDVAVGICNISKDDLNTLRVISDWRLTKISGRYQSDFAEYFKHGMFKEESLASWIKNKNSSGEIPKMIIDQRENSATKIK
jgi:pimeloyl-ACP methyl ester carboxylesterase